jgi:REP element-mobilizing transposase RayT
LERAHPLIFWSFHHPPKRCEWDEYSARITGNKRQVCFASDQDFTAHVSWLKDYSKKYQVDIHAWILMTNPIHLLCTPRADNAVSHMMQSLGRR